MHPGITNNDIVYTERILFGERGKFDWERKDFIKNFDSVDLQAVPGSGKTTALLAKLLLLQKHQPFKDEAGILVLSHTNKAVDLIKERIGLHCPNLFRYPNFVGTIQSFIDNYLAIPFFISEFGKKPVRIDADLYNERMRKGLNYFLGGFTQQEQNNAKYYLRANRIVESYRFDTNDSGDVIIVDSLNGKELTYNRPRPKSKNYSDFSEPEKVKIEEWLTTLKVNTWSEYGFLHYDDAYFLSKCFLLNRPLIKKILQKRFRYVFVDEMQDMEVHQIDILERLFRKKDILNHTFQRIGDNNQAIFSGMVHADATWESINNLKKLRKSIRLSSETAKIVEPFGVKEAKIIGFNEKVNANPLPPHLIVFDDGSITNVIPHFANLIKGYQDDDVLPNNKKAKFKAIGWRKEKEGSDLAIKDYFPSYNIEITSSSADLNCLEDFIFRAEKDNTTKAYHDALLDAMLKILRIEKQKSTDNRNFTKSTLFKFIRDHEEETIRDYYEQLLLNLYKMCSICIKSDVKALKPEFLDFIESFMNEVFNGSISNEMESFIQETRIPVEEEEPFFENNIYTNEEISIEVGTVHSVKGETHCATLYLETYYRQNYESKRLIEQLKGTHFTDTRPVYKQSTKVTYVGLSRPTHLICFAAHKDRIQMHLDELDEWGWEIEDIT